MQLHLALSLGTRRVLLATVLVSQAAMTRLALRQPGNDDERVEVIAYALNERKKLEVLAPAVFPATEPQ